MSYVSPYLQMKPRSLTVARREAVEHRILKGRKLVVTTKRTLVYTICESCGTRYDSKRNRVCPTCLSFNKGG